MILKIITKILIKISQILFDFSRWLEYRGCDVITNYGTLILKSGRKIYPKAFCPGCSIPIEKCYDGRTQPPYAYYCCNCCRSIQK